MPYASQANLVERYGQDTLLVVADRDNDDIPDADVIAQALSDATAEIDAFLAAKYSLPLPTVPDVLVRLCSDIAIYRLASDALQATEERRQRYDDAIALLKAIARGDASLGIPEPPPSSNGGVTLVSEGRRFKRSSMRKLK